MTRTLSVIVRGVHASDAPDARLDRLAPDLARVDGELVPPVERPVAAATGDVILFTDTQVEWTPQWIDAWAAVAAEDVPIAAGPLVIGLPPASPRWLGRSLFAAVAFGGGQPAMRPSLCNLAVRRAEAEAFEHPRSLVTSDHLPRLPGDDEHLLGRIIADRPPRMIQEARAVYRVPSQFCEPRHQFEWLFTFGRNIIRSTGDLRLPYWQRIATDASRAGLDFFDRGALLNLYYGQLYELEATGRTRAARIAYDFICALEWLGNEDLLAEPVVRWLATTPSYLPSGKRLIA